MPRRAPAAPLYAAVMRTLAERGKDVDWLSNSSGVSRSTIYRWREQANPPQRRSVLAVAEALEMDRDEALRDAGVIAEKAEYSPGADLSAVDANEIVTEIQRLLAELQRRIQHQAG